MNKKQRIIHNRLDDNGKGMERLREEQNEVYRLFTENDNKIVENFIKTKAKMDADIAIFKTQIGVFDNDIMNMKNTMDDHDVIVKYNRTAIERNYDEIT